MNNLIGGFYVATLFVALALVAASPVGANETPSLVKQICDNTKRPSQRLTTVGELAELVNVVQSGLVPCPDRIRSAIVDLHNLIYDNEHDVCSPKSANAIADYYGQYLVNREANNNALIEFPKAMKKFFISYGLKVSSFCRKQAIDLLVENSNKSLARSDFEELSQFTGEKGYIAIFVDDPSDEKSYKDLVLPKLFVKMMNSFKRKTSSTNDEKIFLELATTTKINRIQALCERRFRPIYEALVLPLVTLAGIGFNYKGEHLKRESNVNKQVYEWYRIVFLCETMNGVELFQMPEDEMKAANSDRMLVRIMNKEEADELRGDRVKEMEVEMKDLKQIEFKQPELKSMPLDGVIYDKKDSTLEKAVMKFRRQARHHNDPDVARRMVNIAKDKLSRGGIKIIKKWTGIKSLPSNGQLNSTDLVNFLDEYVHAVEKGDSKAIAGLLGDGKGALGSSTQWRWLIKYSWVLLVVIIFAWAGIYIALHG